ncbi:MAG: MFS transporter [Chloroflexi bacterium]|jgi:DHA3 family macrolide efflux protein-like MFS transporter|nr:MFS transporter [Chloroflexota bacterium]
MTKRRKWRVRFFTIWGGQAFSMVGSSLVRFALVWWLTEETGSATVLTSATLISSLPMIGLAPFAGALVDRWDRRWVMVIADAMIALFTGALAYLFWLGIAEVWHVYVVLFLRAFGDVFQTPAMRASTSLLVPKDQLARVGGLNETLLGVINIVSPPLGALLVETINMQGTLAIDLITAMMAIGPLLFIRIPQPPIIRVEGGGAGSSVWQEMITGFRFVWQWQGLFFMFMVLGGLRFFMAPAFSLLPLMVTDHFGGEALELGWINSAHGLGFIAGGFLLSIWGGFKRRTATAVLGLAGLGVGSLAFGLVPADAFWLAMVAMFLRTMMLPMVRGSVMAIFQIHVPPDLQGRVFNLLLSSLSLMAPVGLALGGPLADAYGVPTIFVITGIGCMGIALIWLLNPRIMQLESEGHPRAQA